MPSTGQRARNAMRTREVLAQTAVELFLQDGFDAITVEQVAAAANVSPRTTYRYFHTKEGLALALLADLDNRFLQIVQARPHDEAPLESLRHALAEAWAWLESSGQSETYLALQAFVESHPGLMAANLQRGYNQEELLVAALETRPVFRSSGDLGPRLVVAAFAGASRVAVTTWRRSSGTVPMLINTLDTCIASLLPALQSASEPPHVR
ncbi:TetR/AcrR family transcriptional regulator [Rhodococcus sp. NPDC019647]|uniref:TetR/AcrR family transcriptional regulator n=2 Tax=Rhodococcus TaxID=1827 RepID=UPI0037A540F3